MPFLINRTPTGRIVSLLAEVKYLKEKFGDSSFSLNQMKFDCNSKINQLHFFSLAKRHPEIGLYDPYLTNPLSEAGFHLTQGIQYDSQKSKSVSECMNALEALGWAERVEGGKNRLTKLGLKVAELSYEDPVFYEILRSSLLGYGPFFGMLFKCHSICRSQKYNIVRKVDIEIGYVNTNETYIKDGRRIPLSVGSQKDSIIRTRGALFAWAITGGFLWPASLDMPDKNNWQVSALEIVRKKKWSFSKLRVMIPENTFNGDYIVNEPLEYNAMTKSIKSLRERGQKDIREASMMVEGKVNNRRFAIVYCLSLCASENKKLNLLKLVKELSRYEDMFVVNKEEFAYVMNREVGIAIISGIPFEREKDLLIPLSKIPIDKLRKNAPNDVIATLDKIFIEITK